MSKFGGMTFQGMIMKPEEGCKSRRTEPLAIGPCLRGSRRRETARAPAERKVDLRRQGDMKFVAERNFQRV